MFFVGSAPLWLAIVVGLCWFARDVRDGWRCAAFHERAKRICLAVRARRRS